MKLLQSWWFWFLVRAVVVHSESSCANGEIASDGSCHVFGDHAGNKAVDDMSEDMRVELLQRDLRLSNRRSELAVDEVNVKPWTCATGTSEAYQSTTADDNSWTKIKVMNLISGEYGEVLDVDLNKFSSEKGKGKIRSLNACAINDADDILYCAVVIYGKGTFLMAIDKENNMGFVNKLLGFRYAATFYKGDYYVSGEAGFSVVRGVKDLKKFATFTNLHNANLKHEGEYPLSLDGVSSTKFGLGADFALWKSSNSDVYLAAVKDKNLSLIQLSKDGNPVAPTSVKTIPTDLEMGPGGTRCWGAAWNFKGGLYIAADDGKGFYQLNKLDLANGKASFEKKGEANEIDWNDGFTCWNSSMPDPPIPNGVQCTHSFYQVTTIGGTGNPPESKSDSQTIIRHLTPSGKFVTDFTVNKKLFPRMKSLNACAVNPKDERLYCFMIHEDYQAIATIDKETGPALVAQFDKDFGDRRRSKECFAAVFDENGVYWLWCGPGSMGGDILYSVENLAGKKPKTGLDDDVKKDCITEHKEYTYGADSVGADFIIKKDGKKTYLVSIVESKDNDVSVIDITTASKPGKPELYKAKNLDAKPNEGETKNTWGSAWTAPSNGTYEGRSFFTRDADPEKEESQGKLYEMTDLDPSAKTATFKEAGDAENARWHDGFACQTKILGGIDEPKKMR
jgi:hypothetical protein